MTITDLIHDELIRSTAKKINANPPDYIKYVDVDLLKKYVDRNKQGRIYWLEIGDFDLMMKLFADTWDICKEFRNEIALKVIKEEDKKKSITEFYNIVAEVSRKFPDVEKRLGDLVSTVDINNNRTNNEFKDISLEIANIKDSFTNVINHDIKTIKDGLTDLIGEIVIAILQSTSIGKELGEFAQCFGCKKFKPVIEKNGDANYCSLSCKEGDDPF